MTAKKKKKKTAKKIAKAKGNRKKTRSAVPPPSLSAPVTFSVRTRPQDPLTKEQEEILARVRKHNWTGAPIVNLREQIVDIQRVYDLCDELGASFVRCVALSWRLEDSAGPKRDVEHWAEAAE